MTLPNFMFSGEVSILILKALQTKAFVRLIY